MIEPPNLPLETYEVFRSPLSNELQPDQTVELESLLLADASLRATYFQYFQLDSDLDVLYLGDRASERTLRHIESLRNGGTIPETTDVRVSAIDEEKPSLWGLGWYTVYDFISQNIALSLIIASITMAIILMSMGLIVPKIRQTKPFDPVTTIVAEITTTRETTWDVAGDGNLKNRDLFIGDKVILKSGLAEVTYGSGSRVVLEGPAKYVVLGINRGQLEVGKLVARIDVESAVGFSVKTPSAVIEDLGTEFGAVVDRGGHTDVVVIQGEVAITSTAVLESNVETKKQTFTAGTTVRIEPGAEPVVLDSGVENSRFTALSKLVAGEPGAPPEISIEDGLALWLAADQGVQTDAAGKVIEWRDARASDENSLPAGHAPNESLRPQWAKSALGGKPAVQFEGKQGLGLPTVAELGMLNSGYEVFIVAQCRSPKVNFLLAGPRTHYEIHLNHYATSLGMRFIPNGGEFYDKGRNSDFADGQPHLFTARVDQYRGYRCTVRVDQVDQPDVRSKDGRSAAEGPLWLGMMSGGSYGLEGEIAEVMIYRDALSRAQRQEVEAYLAEKYGLSSKN